MIIPEVFSPVTFIPNVLGQEGIHYFQRLYINSYIVEMEDGLMVVDTGFRDFGPHILASIRKLGYLPENIKLIILTHAHIDHAGGAQWLQKNTGAQIAAHRLDVPYLAKGGVGILPRRMARSSYFWGPFKKAYMAIPPVHVDRELEDGDSIGEWVVIHTPGHTPGMISLYSPSRKVLISEGFILTMIPNTPGKPPRLMPNARIVNYNQAQVSASIKKLANLDIETLLMLHKKPHQFASILRILRRWRSVEE